LCGIHTEIKYEVHVRCFFACMFVYLFVCLHACLLSCLPAFFVSKRIVEWIRRMVTRVELYHIVAFNCGRPTFYYYSTPGVFRTNYMKDINMCPKTNLHRYTYVTLKR
jgi:hypothetical protein